MQFEEEQIRVLVDGENGKSSRASQAPTKANLLANFQWLMEGAQPGDSLFLLFCGYGTQHPKEPGSKEYEAYLVPSDFDAELPQDWVKDARDKVPVAATPFPTPAPSAPPSGTNTPAASFVAAAPKAAPEKARYRLISLLELNRYVSQIPADASITLVLDCSYPAVPGLGPSHNVAPTFNRVSRGRVDYRKLHDFVSRPRFLELPPLLVQHTPPQIWRPQAFPACRVHAFCACRLQEWDAELPLEGTVQGTFTWAFAKALAAGSFQCSVGNLHSALEQITFGLKEHFQGVEQTPVLMLSQSACVQDIVLS